MKILNAQMRDRQGHQPLKRQARLGTVEFKFVSFYILFGKGDLGAEKYRQPA